MAGQREPCQNSVEKRDRRTKIQSRREIRVTKPFDNSRPSTGFHSPSFPLRNASSQTALARKPIVFTETKNPQTHPEASLLVPTELGEGVESLLEQDSKPICPGLTVYTPIHVKLTLLAARRCRGLWFQSSFVTFGMAGKYGSTSSRTLVDRTPCR
jgi:hypothetical protein